MAKARMALAIRVSGLVVGTSSGAGARVSAMLRSVGRVEVKPADFTVRRAPAVQLAVQSGVAGARIIPGHEWIAPDS